MRNYFAVTGEVWNHIKTDIIAGGQCLDSLEPFLNDNETFKIIYNLWKKYHLLNVSKIPLNDLETIKNIINTKEELTK